VLAPETPVVIPKRLKEGRSRSSPGTAQYPPPRASKQRSAGFRRAGSSGETTAAGGREALAFFRKEQAVRQAAALAAARRGGLTSGGGPANASPANGASHSNGSPPAAGGGCFSGDRAEALPRLPAAVALVSCPSGEAVVNLGNLDLKVPTREDGARLSWSLGC
jgi:hypothetical protein